MTYADIFEYCLVKAKLHFSKLKDVLFSPSECFDGDYYKNYPNWDFVTTTSCWSISMITGLAPLVLETRQDAEVLKWVNQFKREYHEKVYSAFANTTHDLGLLYVPYSVHLWQLTGDKEHRMTALKAADVLAKRFNIYGRYIEPWKRMDNMEDRMGRITIASAANVSLLYWAWKETGHHFYHDVANAHLDTLIKTLVRGDYSTAYEWICDSFSGELWEESKIGGLTGDTYWARGSAWLVFGLAVAYSYTKKEDFLKVATKVGEKYLKSLGGKIIPAWNLRLPADRPAMACHKSFYQGVHWDEAKKENTIYNVDTIAASIMCCAFLMIHKMKKNEQFAQYVDDALMEMAEHYLVPDMQKTAMLCRADGRDIYSPCGDYFFFYALVIKLYGIIAPWKNEFGEGNVNVDKHSRGFVYDEFSDRYTSDSKVSRILKYISANIDKPLTVKELAEEFHFHPSHLNRVFKKAIGVTPALYVKTKKMNTAKWYLENSDLRIHEIMQMVGENDQAMFSKSFKRFFTLSPKEYRKLHRRETDI